MHKISISRTVKKITHLAYFLFHNQRFAKSLLLASILMKDCLLVHGKHSILKVYRKEAKPMTIMLMTVLLLLILGKQLFLVRIAQKLPPAPRPKEIINNSKNIFFRHVAEKWRNLRILRASPS
jgi:hypothetical protein